MASASSPPASANRHFSVGANGEQVMEFSLKSEALGMPADKGHGWAQLEFGEAIGGDQRYTIVRKLGWGCIRALVWPGIKHSINMSRSRP